MSSNAIPSSPDKEFPLKKRIGELETENFQLRLLKKENLVRRKKHPIGRAIVNPCKKARNNEQVGPNNLNTH